ncbi:MAG: hypothetical protein V1773_07055 [bacterium]
MGKDKRVNIMLYQNDDNLSKSLNQYFEFYLKMPTQFNSVNKYLKDSPLEVNFDSLDEKIFEDKHFALFPSYLSYTNNREENKSNYGHPLSIFSIINIDIDKEIKKIKNIIECFVKFKHALEEIYKDGKYEILWNKYIPELLNRNKKNIILLNTQFGSTKFWDKIIIELFTKGIPPNTFFVFYWFTENKRFGDNNKANKDYHEFNDYIMGKSRFLRDFLIENNRATEIEIYYGAEENNHNDEYIEKFKIFKNIIFDEKHNEEYDGKYFTDLSCKILNSLKNLLGDSVLKLFNQTSDIGKIFVLYSKIYIYNKNRFTDPVDGLTNNNSNTHKNLKQKEALIRYLEYGALGKLEYTMAFHKNMASLLKALIHYKKKGNYTFLFIDDSPLADEIYKTKLDIIKLWFKGSTFYFLDESSWGRLLNCKNVLGEKFKIIKYKGQEGNEIIKESISKITPDFILVDLEYDSQVLGFELLSILRKEINKLKNITSELIAFSRFEDPFIIRKALNYGAIFYITKANFLWLIEKVYNLKDTRHTKYIHNFENWHLLNKLEPSKIKSLKDEFITGKKEYRGKYKWAKDHKFTKDYLWVKKLPKADLHCHIGSCLNSDLLPKTAFLVLMEKIARGKISIQSISEIIKFVRPVAVDPFLVHGSIVKEVKETLEYKKALKRDYNGSESQSILKIIWEKYEKEEYKIIPEETLFDPKSSAFERNSDFDLLSRYQQNKIKLRQSKDVSYDDVILIFILLIYIRENKNVENLVGEIKKFFKDIKLNKEWDYLIEIFDNDEVMIFFNLLKDEQYNFNSFHNANENSKIIQQLQSSFSRADENKSLYGYLRGCEYGGSAHLQTKASIFMACHHIVENAKADNIRYLELRCAVDGYSSFGLQSNDEAMIALLKGFEYFTAKKEGDKKIYINLIITAKRHKSFNDFDKNVSLALKYRHGLDFFEDEEYKLDKPKVVSFDLAGLEKGNRPKKFYENFQPLLKECFPITIHAGEEDNYEAIWEAIYLIQSQRLGHALTLMEKKELLNLVRERQIAIELCPISNYLTNKKYSGKEAEIYPLREYFNKGLTVTVNTDNPVVSESNMTKEYIFAAAISKHNENANIDGFSKWEMLRLIKNSFKSASIPKEAKRKLLCEIEQELFEILTNE